MNRSLTEDISNSLWQQLLKTECIDASKGEMPPAETLTTPWYLAVLQGFAGWFAAMFLLGFMASFGALIFSDGNQNKLFLVFGSLYVALSLFFDSKRFKQQVFTSQLAFVCALSGLFAIGWAVFDWFEHANMSYFYLIYLTILAGYCLLSRNTLALFVNGLTMAACLAGLFYEWQIMVLIPLLLLALAVIACFNLNRFGRQYSRLLTLTYAFTCWALIAQLLLLLIDSNLDFMQQTLLTFSLWYWLYPWIFSFVVSVYLLLQIFKQLQLPLQSPQGYCATTGLLALTLLSIPMAGLSCAILFLLLGLFMHNKIIFNMALLSVPLFIGVYYYALQVSLLEKSLLLIGLGLLMLIARFVISRLLKPISGESDNGTI